MAKFYQRQSTGGRFDRKSTGDLGLRAFKDQQDQILDSLKLQRLRSFEYGKQNIQDIESSQRKEQNWKEELQQLETKIHNNKVKNITKRGENEADILLTKAEEYKRESEFWQDFAPKFSKGLGDIAQGIEGYLGKKAAEKKIKEWEEDGGLDEYHGLEDKSAQFATDGASKIIEDKKDPNEGIFAHKLHGTAKVIFEKEIAARLKAAEEGIFKHITEQLDASDKVDHENFTTEAYSLLDQIIRAEGIDPRSKAAKSIKTNFTRRISAESIKRRRGFQSREGRKAITEQHTKTNNLSKDITGNDIEYRSSEFRKLNSMNAVLLTQDEDGKPIDPKDSDMRFIDKNGKSKINHQKAGLTSYLQLVDHIESPSEYSSYEDWKAKHNYLTSDGEEFLIKHSKTYDPVLKEAYIKRISDLNKTHEELEKTETTSLKWKAAEDLAKYDLTDPKQRQELISKWHEHPPGHPARSLISEAMGYDPKHHNTIDHINNLQTAILLGDTVEAIELYSYLTPKGKDAYTSKIKALNELAQNNITYDSILKESVKVIESISKKGKLTSATSDPSDDDAAKGRAAAWFFYNNELIEEIPAVNLRVREIEARLTADLKENDNEGRGWARRSSPDSQGSNVRWLNYVGEEQKNITRTTATIRDELSYENNTLESILNMTQGGTVVAQDDLDTINDVVLKGYGEIPKRENVAYLAARFNMTENQMWNEIIKHKYGEDAILIPPSPTELAIQRLQESEYILPNSINHYSSENLIRLNILTKLAENQPAGINAYMKKELTNPIDWSIAPTSNKITEGYKYVDKDGNYPIYNPLAGTTYFD